MNKNNTPSIEERIVALEKTVAWFDSEEFVLEQAIAKYEEAEKLATDIQQEIAQLKNTIEQVGSKTE